MFETLHSFQAKTSIASKKAEMSSIRIISFVIFLVVTQEWITESAEVDFSPLPKGKEYKLKELRSSDGWSLEKLHSVAKEIALVVKPKPPYGTRQRYVVVKITF